MTSVRRTNPIIIDSVRKNICFHRTACLVSFWCWMLNPFPMLGLKSWKERRDTDANESKQRYEGKRKDCHLNEKWKTGRPWLVFLENNTMACNVCINHYGKNLSGSREQNTFISGCSNLKVLAVSGHERSKMHLWKIIRQDRSKCQHKWSWQSSFILKRVWQV